MIKAQKRAQNISLKLNANRGQRGQRLLYHVDRRQRVGGGHVRADLLDGPDGMLDLAPVVLAGRLSIGEGLAG